MAAGQPTQRTFRVLGVSMLAGILSAACQAQSDGATQLPSRIVLWEDPETGVQGQTIRDANNERDRVVIVGSNGSVQFVSDGTVCNNCETTDATIDLGGGNLIDIRFGVGAVGDDVRRPFLVDRASGNFIQLRGGGDQPVTFEVTGTPLEEPNDRSDDMAIRAGGAANPTLDNSGADQSAALCGAAAATIPLVVLGLLLTRLARRR